MGKEVFFVSNVKCNGCVENIRKNLGEEDGVAAVSVDIPSGRVEIEGEGMTRAQLAIRLKTIGYPEKNA